MEISPGDLYTKSTLILLSLHTVIETFSISVKIVMYGRYEDVEIHFI